MINRAQMQAQLALLIITTIFSLSLANAHAQIGWTLNQCRKHWGRESIATHHLETLNDTTYSFGSRHSGIQKEVTFDQHGKVNDVIYMSRGGGRYDNKPSLLWPGLSDDVPGLLALEAGVIWQRDPDASYTSSHEFFLGKKDGVAVFHAGYFSTKTGEALHVGLIGTEL